MKTTHILIVGILGFTALLGNASPCCATGFAPGEVLVNVGSTIERYSPSGTLLQTYTGTGTIWGGAALTPDGNLATDFRSPTPGINIFNPSGTQVTSFAVTGSSGTLSDMSVFANGTLAVNDQNGSAVQFYSQTGTLLQTVSLPGVANPWGNTVGSDGILYVAGINSNNLAKVDSSGSFLGLISLSFQPGDLIMNPADGTLWVTGNDSALVMHLKTDGTVLGSFATGFVSGSGGFDGIGLAPDDNSLFVSHELSTVVKHFDLNGNLQGSFNRTQAGAFFISVVPQVPEPATLAMLALGGLALLRRRRQR